MSSNVQYVDFRTKETRILQEMLKRAGYVTANIRPLTGNQSIASRSVLRRFMAGVMVMQDPVK